MTARDPMKASPPGLPPGCMPPTWLRWRYTAVRGWPAHRLPSSLSLQYESRLQIQGEPGAEVSAYPPAFRAPCRADNAGAEGAGGSRGRARAGGRGRPRGCAWDRLRGVSLASSGVQRARLCPGGRPGVAEGPQLPSSPQHGQERKRRKLIAITYKGKRFLGSSPPAPAKLCQVR